MSTNPVVIEFASLLDAPCEMVWRRVSTIEGVNAELWPITMRFPRAVHSLENIRPGDAPIDSVISLLGVVPMDWHRFTLVGLAPGESFHEESHSLWMRRWTHKRRLEASAEKCLLCDRIEFVHRIGWLTPWLEQIYRNVFAKRHRRLRAHFGGEPVTLN